MASINVNGVSLNYQIDGDLPGAPWIMLSNSLASNLTMWDRQVPALLAAGFRVLRYDTRGHGASQVPPGPYTIEMLANDALALLDALKLERVHFCGLSMGGMTGQMLATHHGSRLSSLVLCATAAYTGPPDLWAGRIKMVIEGGMAAVADATIDRWFTSANQQRIPDEVARVKSGLLATSPLGYAACGAAIRDMDQRESIRRIKVPTRVMVGALDPSTTVAAAEFLHERIAGSELVVIPDSQHFFNVEFPDEFNAALLDFLWRHCESH